jgi:EmrB/QacA subfamily drug resistance transporter
MSLHHQVRAQTVAHPRRWTALVLLCLAEFMLILDATAANVALPRIGADLSMGRTALTWVVTAYVLAFGGLMLLGGRLADTLGRRRVLLAGIVLFTLGSLACGLTGSGALLIAARVAQGVGAALVAPAALSTITTMFSGAERNKALGVWAAIGGSGFVVGMIVSGVLTAGPGWRWVFFVNVPVGLLALVVLPTVLPAEPVGPAAPGGRLAGGRVDVGGAVLVTAAAGLLVYGLTAAGDSGWTAPGTLMPIAAAIALGAAFVGLERRVANPLMRVPLLTQRPVLSGVFVMLLASGLMLSMYFLSSVYLQHVRGYDALRTGLAFVPGAVAVTIGAHLGSRLVGRVGARYVAVAAFASAAVGAALLTRLDESSGIWTGLVPGLVLAAFGLGPAFVVATSTALARVEPHEAGLTSGIVNTGHEIGGAVGVGVTSALAAATFAGGGAAGITDAFTLMAVVAGVAALLSLVLIGRERLHAAHGHGH